MTRLRTAKLAGVKGVRRKVSLRLQPGQPDKVVPAVCYGQWAIHRTACGFGVTHVPSGCGARCGALLQDNARRFVEGLLAVRDFKTPRAKAAIKHCRAVYSIWKAGN